MTSQLSNAVAAAILLSAVGAKAQPGAGTTSPAADAVPQVDPVTGRPLRNAAAAEADVVDQEVAVRLRGEQPDTDTVPAYIPLPTVAADPFQVPRGRIADRARQARRLPGLTVRENPRPEYQAQGIRSGSILMFPFVSAGWLADSNVYTENNGRSDVAGVAAAGFNMRSDWGLHSVQADGVVRRRGYLKFETESTTSYRLAMNGRYDLSTTASLYAGTRHERVVLDRSVVEEVGAQALPPRFTITSGELRGGFDNGAFQFDVGGTLGRTNYKDNRSFAGTRIDQSFRSYDAFGVEVNAAADIGGQRSAFVQVNYDDRDADRRPGDLNRDSKSYRIIAGLRGGVTSLIRGSVGIGYIKVDFVDPLARDLNALAVEADVDWLASRLTTVSLQMTRSLLSVAQANSRGALATNLRLSVDHEAARNLILSGNVSQQWANYIGDPRQARSTGTGVAATYLVSRTMQVRSQLSYRKRTDRGFGIDAAPRDVTGGLEVTFRL